MNELTQSYSISFGEMFSLKINILHEVVKKPKHKMKMQTEGGERLAEMEIPDLNPDSLLFDVRYKVTFASTKLNKSFDIIMDKHEYSAFVNSLSMFKVGGPYG